MHALVVVAHPDPTSLSHSVGARIVDGISTSDQGHSAELADLAAEGFDPRFSAADLAVHRRHAPPPADVASEQGRIDRGDALVLVYPVYWWSMPALLKGWIDRVFANGWRSTSAPTPSWSRSWDARACISSPWPAAMHEPMRGMATSVP
jgi:NAD(P)H dehydrogenase (quinone)